MNPFEIAALTAAIFNFVITAVVVRSSPRSPLTVPYLLWGISVTVWNLGAFHAFGGADPVDNTAAKLSQAQAVLWLKVLQAGVIMMPVSLMHVCLVITGIKPGRWLWSVYALHGGFILSLFSDLFVRSANRFSFGYWTAPGPAFWAFLGSYVIMTSGLMAVLYSRQKDLTGMPRTRVRSLLAALIALWIFGTNDLLPIFSFSGSTNLYYPFTNSTLRFLPLGSFAAIFYALIIAYSVLQHQLLDVHIALGRVSAHLIRFAFLFAIGLALQLIIWAFFRDEFTPISFASSLVVLMVSTLLGAFLFPRLVGNRTENVERAPRGDRFEFQDRVRAFAKRMSGYQDMNSLLDDLHEL
nr:hypothetical protein [Verrucomicrobiota bacterium]